ncbi:MAG TPA: fibronectin type III domain-containing protein [Vicinamibacterales bacterium]|nr:fibronectin type III domain-containing protein [Vicinamibacterales bacterium]
MSRSRTRFHAGRDQSQRVKPFEMFLGDVRLIRQDKKAAAATLGTTVASIAWESTDDTIDLSGEALSNSEGSVAIAPEKVGVHLVKSTTTYANGLRDVDYWRVVVREPDFTYVPPCPTLIDPDDGAILLTETTVTLEWASVARADEYRVYLWEDGDSKPASPTATVDDTEYEATGLTAGTLYHWSVDVVSGVQVSDGCVEGDFTTLTIVCPTLVSPANNATLDDPNTVTLDWAATPGAVEYEVYFWEDGDPEPVTPTYTLAATQKTINGLEAGVTYHWRVIAVGESTSSTGCGMRTFTSDTPGCPGLQIPTEGSSVGEETSTILLWEDVDGATSYQVFVWEDGDPQPGVPTATTVDNTYEVTGLSLGTTYHWVVNSVNGSFVTSGCASSTFSTDAAPAVIEWQSAAFTGDILGDEVTLYAIRSGNTGTTASADYSFTPGTALAGPDYVSTPGTVTFNPGEVIKPVVVALVRDYDAEVLADTPESYWKFNEAASATTFNDQAGSRDLTLTSTTNFSYQQPTLNLSSSLSAAKTGTNSWRLSTNVNDLITNGDSFTIRAWVDFNDTVTASSRSLFQIGGPGGSGQFYYCWCYRTTAGTIAMSWHHDNPGLDPHSFVTKNFTTSVPLAGEFWFEAGFDYANSRAFFKLNDGAAEYVSWSGTDSPNALTSSSGRVTYLWIGQRPVGNAGEMIDGKFSQYEFVDAYQIVDRWPRWNLDASLDFTATLSNPTNANLGPIDETVMTIEAP